MTISTAYPTDLGTRLSILINSLGEERTFAPLRQVDELHFAKDGRVALFYDVREEQLTWVPEIGSTVLIALLPTKTHSVAAYWSEYLGRHDLIMHLLIERENIISRTSVIDMAQKVFGEQWELSGSLSLPELEMLPNPIYFALAAMITMRGEDKLYNSVYDEAHTRAMHLLPPYAPKKAPLYFSTSRVGLTLTPGELDTIYLGELSSEHTGRGQIERWFQYAAKELAQDAVDRHKNAELNAYRSFAATVKW